MDVFAFSWIDDRSFATNLNGLLRLGDLEYEIDRLFLTQARKYSVILLRIEALRFHSYRVSARFQLRKIEPARVIGTWRFASVRSHYS